MAAATATVPGSPALHCPGEEWKDEWREDVMGGWGDEGAGRGDHQGAVGRGWQQQCKAHLDDKETQDTTRQHL